ncbi:hypothetical protein GOV14_07080 [Candidatus Pacearchaeota archaeon]|nr:hypothetical protein [Candidatus Pacearchaeota archaeon]
MNFDNLIKKRASIRHYTNKKIKIDSVIDAIEAANTAPSPGNLPLLKYMIIEDKETIDKIAVGCQQEFIKQSPVLVIICSDANKCDIMYPERSSKYLKHHVGAAVENFLLKITDMKLACCWIGAFSDSTIKNILRIPENIEVEVVLPIAYERKGSKTKQKKKNNLSNIIYFNTWKNKKQAKPTMVRN